MGWSISGNISLSITRFSIILLKTYHYTWIMWSHKDNVKLLE